ncbi:uncharacterized protein LOC130915175 isoform X2 [Corythoichthys intestinalis]|uniref:uncharacterized protein LOC130915175 isoform X2 n=1 Tax=Corythoichthys intestinalis TaxID=161448 RepID=UPI0025A500A0|nr:uncharacterized protein LOC130915175 isoform X2 [Corythoichthys intestinalis]
MPTKKLAILESLENLSKKNYDRFCVALVDRRGKRRVALSKVEDEPRTEVTNVLVSTFTEATAPSIVCELLRQIGCFDEAENLNVQIAQIDKESLNASPDKPCSVTDRRPVQGCVGPSPRVNCDRFEQSKNQRRSSGKEKGRMDAAKAKEHAQIAQNDRGLLNAAPDKPCPVTDLRPVQGAVGPSPGVSCDIFERPKNRRRRSRKEKERMNASTVKENKDAQIAKIDKKSLNAAPDKPCPVTDQRPVQGAVGTSPRVTCDSFQQSEDRRRSSKKEKKMVDPPITEEPAQALMAVGKAAAIHSKDAPIAKIDKKSLNAAPDKLCPATDQRPVQGAIGPSPEVICDSFQQSEDQQRSTKKEKRRMDASIAEEHSQITQIDQQSLNATPDQPCLPTFRLPVLGAVGPSFEGSCDELELSEKPNGINGKENGRKTEEKMLPQFSMKRDPSAAKQTPVIQTRKLSDSDESSDDSSDYSSGYFDSDDNIFDRVGFYLRRTANKTMKFMKKHVRLKK